MRYLLDTNIISHMMREPSGTVVMRVAGAGEKSVFTSLLAIAEIRFGILKKNSKKLEQALNKILPYLQVEPWASPADRHYAETRAFLEANGITTGQLDLLLASQALATNAIIVTDNVKHFSRVPGLKVENWLR